MDKGPPASVRTQGDWGEPLPATQLSGRESGLSLQGRRAAVLGGEMRREEGALQLQTPSHIRDREHVHRGCSELGKGRKGGEGLKERRERWVGEWTDGWMVDGL